MYRIKVIGRIECHRRVIQIHLIMVSFQLIFAKLGIVLIAFGSKWTICFLNLFEKCIVDKRRIARYFQVTIIMIVFLIAFSIFDLLSSSNLVLIFLVESFFQIRCISRPFRRILKGASRSFRCSV